MTKKKDPSKKKGRMAHVNLRLPKHVLQFYRTNYPNYTVQLRKVLEDFIASMDDGK